jgi:3-mercaptopyruvate sulfurtransferase SseA
MTTKVKCLFLIMSLIAIAGQGFAVTQPQEAQVLAQVQEEARRGNYKLITPESMRDRFLKNPSSLFLVDARQEWEYQREHIKGSVNLPVAPTWWTQYSPSARAEMKKLIGPDKKREVVFY